jgi:hypothetical protein
MGKITVRKVSTASAVLGTLLLCSAAWAATPDGDVAPKNGVKPADAGRATARPGRTAVQRSSAAGAYAQDKGYSPDYSWAVGVNVGATWQHGFPTRSSAGFYNGDVSSTTGLVVGGSLFRDVYKLAPTYPTVSLGVVLDTFAGVPLHFSGTCGGVPCVGDGRLNQINVIGEIKLTEPIAPLVTINGYVGGGLAFVSPTGSPTGGTKFADETQTTGAWRVGGGFDVATGKNTYLGVKGGYQWTSRVDFSTTLPNERFLVDTYGNFYVAAGWTAKFSSSGQ